MRFLVLLLLPTMTFAESKFSNESEVSLIQTGGNSSVETYNAKTKSTWEADKSIYVLAGHYTLGTSENKVDNTNETEKVESARNWDAQFRYEQVLTNVLNGFLAVQYEGDEFSGFKQRENLDVGAKYFITKTEKTNSFTEFGARYTIEKKLVRDDDNKDILNYTKARLYYEIAHKKSSTLSYKFWIEYLPNFTESEDYLITYEPSIAYVLSDTFSLKTAYKAVYDNKPNVDGNDNTDYTFTTSVIAKF
ncbi:MAG: DUF481 domain-containing protein [Halobacteriovoraceae bacterium]|jgi:putative salt-induced outer membrane protein|nr:DUF481 domain-containing protein [Halobacteriovoraceae bacterium]